MYGADGQADRRAVRGAERRKTDRQPRIAVTLGAPSASCAVLRCAVGTLPTVPHHHASRPGRWDGWMAA